MLPNQDKLLLITKNRVKMSLCLIMVIEHREASLEELVKYTGFDFIEVNKITKDLVRLKLVYVLPTDTLPIFKIIDIVEARKFLKLLEENLYLD